MDLWDWAKQPNPTNPDESEANVAEHYKHRGFNFTYHLYPEH